ncbi:unnamed protein product [Pylaiella littoralis]
MLGVASVDLHLPKMFVQAKQKVLRTVGGGTTLLTLGGLCIGFDFWASTKSEEVKHTQRVQAV